MNEPNESALIARAAGRASERPGYLGWLFARYAEAEQKTDQEIADMLGLSPVDYHRLRLCLRPRSQFFIEDVQQIAARFGVVTGELATVIRHVEAVEGMKTGQAESFDSEAGLLMAARARRKRGPSQKKGKKRDVHTKQ